MRTLKEERNFVDCETVPPDFVSVQASSIDWVLQPLRYVRCYLFLRKSELVYFKLRSVVRILPNWACLRECVRAYLATGLDATLAEYRVTDLLTVWPSSFGLWAVRSTKWPLPLIAASGVHLCSAFDVLYNFRALNSLWNKFFLRKTTSTQLTRSKFAWSGSDKIRTFGKMNDNK